MGRKERQARFWAVPCLTLLVGLIGWPVVVSATTRVGNSEIQLVYEQQHTFQSNGGDDLEWVQWRNEVRVEYTYDSLVNNGRLFDQVTIPFIRKADFSLIYRARFDPAYLVRDKYENIFDDELRSNFEIPENEFREIFLDTDFGEVFGHKLSMRLGRQQIVWGESDLFRSLDIINPLRIDQNGLIGEAFEDYRTPIWAIKFLYDIGNVGSYFSNVGIEALYSPRWRPISNDILVDEAWRMGLLTPERLGPRAFRPQRPSFGGRKFDHPWDAVRIGPNQHRDASDFGCVTPGCRADAPGERLTFLYNIEKANGRHHFHGTRPDETSMGGVRILGKAFDNFDFTLNYLFKRSEAVDTLDVQDSFTFVDGVGLVPRPDTIYGDFGPGPGLDPVGDFETGLHRCLVERKATFLTGADLRGYDTNDNPNDDRAPITVCARPYQRFPWTHVMGFTVTYNDFDYTGAVFRLEQSYSTKEARWQRPAFVNPQKPAPTLAEQRRFFNTDGKVNTPVWRSMIGFDLVQSLSSFPGMGWARALPGELGTQQTFFTAQFLTRYNVGRNSNLLAAHTTDALADRVQRWENLATFSTSGFYFKGKLEPLLAFAYEVNTRFPLLYVQSFWHGLYFKNLDVLGGVIWYMGSKNAGSENILNHYADRDTIFLRAIYYLL